MKAEICSNTGLSLPNLPDLPEWLWQKQIDSGSGVYDTLNPQLRARLKSQIAFLYHYWGEGPDRLERRMPWLEHSICDSCAPIPWVLFLFDQNYASASELLAALMPAVLAKSPLLLACRINTTDTGAQTLPLALSAAFELIGQEQVFDLNIQDAVRLLEYLALQNFADAGRVVAFGSAEWARAVFLTALERNIWSLSLPDKPVIAVQENCTVDFDLLRWAHPLAEIFTFSSSIDAGDRFKSCHALISEKDISGINSGFPIHLQPGSEALWLWPWLNPAFFCKRSAGIFSQKQRYE
jgi:hypothetical protein